MIFLCVSVSKILADGMVIQILIENFIDKIIKYSSDRSDPVR